MKKLYVVYAAWGNYSDYTERDIAAYPHPNSAKAHQKAAEQEYQLAKEKSDGWVVKEEHHTKVYDVDFTESYIHDDLGYYVKEITLFDDFSDFLNNT